MTSSPPSTLKDPSTSPSSLRAWCSLVQTSWQRQARAHLMVWIAFGLLAIVALWVVLITHIGGWDPPTWQMPRRGGMTYRQWVLYLRFAPASVLAHKSPPDFTKQQLRFNDRWAH